MAGLTERQLVTLLGRRFQTPSRDVCVGIGDDAAVLTEDSGARVVSVDASVEGVHFDRAYLTLEDVGYRSFQAAVSDLAAMGAEPVGALSALILPRSTTARQIEQLTSGQAAASLVCRCPIVGGNISRGRELSVTTTVLGRCERPLRRDTARSGDELWLVGSLGLAAAGLAGLRLTAESCPHAGDSAASEPGFVPARNEGQRSALERCIDAWRRPEAQLARGRQLVGIASAAIDVSDGLAADAWQLARASGVRVVVQGERLRAALRPELLGASRMLRRSALHFALYGGEDYALLATGPSSQRPSWADVIGYVTKGQGAALATYRGTRLLGRGYDHLIRD
jgi:thiamine-monophosphate kinase